MTSEACGGALISAPSLWMCGEQTRPSVCRHGFITGCLFTLKIHFLILNPEVLSRKRRLRSHAAEIMQTTSAEAPHTSTATALPAGRAAGSERRPAEAAFACRSAA